MNERVHQLGIQDNSDSRSVFISALGLCERGVDPGLVAAQLQLQPFERKLRCVFITVRQGLRTTSTGLKMRNPKAVEL